MAHPHMVDMAFICRYRAKLLLAIIGTILLLTIVQIINAQKHHHNLSNKFDRLQQTVTKNNRRLINEAVEQQTNHDNSTSHNSNLNSASYSDLMLRAFIRINNMRAYHQDLHSYRPSAEHSGDPSFIDSDNYEHKKRCARHLIKYHHLLKSFKESDPMQETISLDAIKLADTFGRPEAGILHGNQFWLGSYADCLDLKITDDEPSLAQINSQYCLGVSQFPNWKPQDSKTSIKSGLCLPETCTNSMLNNDVELFQLVDQMMKYQFGSDMPFKRINLKQIYCLPHETSQVRQFSLSAQMLIGVFAMFTIMCLCATILDYIDGTMPENLKSLERNKRRILIEAFSLGRNFNKFITISENHPQPLQNTATGSIDANDDFFNRQTFFDVISGLKSIGLMWIIFAHTFLVSPITDQNLIHFDGFTKTYFANILLTAHLMVDTFFALSGLLASYLMFKFGVSKMKTKDWIIATVHRYYRLTPIYLLCYWFTKSIGSQLGSGPYWDYGTAPTSPRLQCADESWWVVFLHLSDFKSPKDHCIPFAWFIANGIKFWMVTPFILTMINRSMKKGYKFTLAIILVNIALVINLAYTSNVDMKSVIEFKPEAADNMLNNMGEVYSRPYSRIGPYLIGLLAGHMFYLIDTKQIQINLSPSVKRIIWTWFTVTTILLTFVIKIAGGLKVNDDAIPHIFAISSGLLRPLWALCTCWLVFALAHGQAKMVSKFLSAGIWKYVAKISFCAYLAQGEVIAQLYLGKTVDSSFAYVDMFARPIVVTSITILVSIMIVLFIEFPLTAMEELLLPKKNSQSKSIQQNGNSPTATQMSKDNSNAKLLDISDQIVGDNNKLQDKIISNGNNIKLKSI